MQEERAHARRRETWENGVREREREQDDTVEKNPIECVRLSGGPRTHKHTNEQWKCMKRET